jgi:hypothetical protein
MEVLYMKRFIVLCLLLIGAGIVRASVIDFTSSAGSTGSVLDNETVSGATNDVAEIEGLGIVTTFGASEGTVDYLNAVSDQLGINSDLANEGTSYFDTDEWLELAFTEDITITAIKFANFTEGDSVRLTIGGASYDLTDSDLDGVNNYEPEHKWSLAEGQSIRIEALSKSVETNTAGGFGLQQMVVSIPEPMTVSLMAIAGLFLLLARRHLDR